MKTSWNPHTVPITCICNVLPRGRHHLIDAFSLCSQPPLLSSMVLEVYRATGDVAFVRKVFHSLLKEHSFWMSGAP